MSDLAQLRAQVTEQHQRITELEIDAAFRRQTLDALDEVIRAQADQIDALTRRLAELLDGALAPAGDD